MPVGPQGCVWGVFLRALWWGGWGTGSGGHGYGECSLRDLGLRDSGDKRQFRGLRGLLCWGSRSLWGAGRVFAGLGSNPVGAVGWWGAGSSLADGCPLCSPPSLLWGQASCSCRRTRRPAAPCSTSSSALQRRTTCRWRCPQARASTWATPGSSWHATWRVQSATAHGAASMLCAAT